jgi:hypothetical protein
MAPDEQPDAANLILPRVRERVSKLLTRKNGKRLGLAAIACVVLGLLLRNPISRLAAESVGSWVLGTRVEIGEVRIGWSQIAVCDLVVHEPNDACRDLFPPDTRLADEKQIVQVTVAKILLLPSPLRGFREGVWLRRIVVDKPKLHLRFDQTGELLTRFPEPGEQQSAGGVIPIAQLLVREAGFVIHQPGRESFSVEGIEVAAQFDAAIRAHLKIPEIVEGEVRFRCELDAQTFAGSSKFEIAGCRLRTDQLARFPLVPQQLGIEAVECAANLTIECQHPADQFDPRHLAIRLKATVDDIVSTRLGKVCERIELNLSQQRGAFTVDCHAKPLGGDAHVNAYGDWFADQPSAEIRWNCAGVRIEDVRNLPAELESVKGQCDVDGHATLAWSDLQLSFDAQTGADLSGASISGFAAPKVTMAMRTNGSVGITGDAPLRGNVQATAHIAQYDLGRLAADCGYAGCKGVVRLAADASARLEDLQDLSKFTAGCEITGRGLKAEGLTVDDWQIDFALTHAIASLTTTPLVLRDQQGSVAAQGSGRVQVDLGPGGEVQISSNVEFQPTRQMVQRLGMDRLRPVGRLSGTLGASCRVNEMMDVVGWRADVRLEGDSIRLADEPVSDFDARLRLAAGSIECSPVTLRWRDSTCAICSSAQVDRPLNLMVRIDAVPLQVADIAMLISRFSETPLHASGLATIDGSLVLSASPFRMNAAGGVRLLQCRVGDHSVGDASLSWRADLNGLTLAASSQDFFGGRFLVEAHASQLDWTRTVVDGKFEAIEVPRLVAVFGQRLMSTGVLGGGFQLTSIASLDALTGSAWLHSRQLSVQKIPVEIQIARVDVAEGAIVAHSEGTAAGGRFTFQSRGSIPQLVTHFESTPVHWEGVPVGGQFKMVGVQIPKVIEALGLSEQARNVSGLVSVQCDRDATRADGRNLCTAIATVEKLRWNRAPLSDRIIAEIEVRPNQLELVGVDGRFADGRLSGTAVLDVAATPQGRFDLAANRVNLRRAADALGVDDVSGSLTIRTQGRIGPVIQGRTEVSIDNALVAGVDLRKSRFPIDFTYGVASRTARWQCRAGTVAVGGGNVHIATEGNFQSNLSMATSVRLQRVNLAKLMRGRSIGSGIVDGEASLRAKHATEAKQFVGQYAFEVENIQALELPILNQLPTMISLSPPLPGRGRDGGFVSGRISNGMVLVDELALYQSNVQVLVSGDATFDGRLNLDIIASTESGGPADQILELADSPLMLAAPAPVALIAKANDLMKDRVVRVHVGGNAQRPTMRLQPGKQLSQDAVRFFLNNSVGTDARRLTETSSRYRRR